MPIYQTASYQVNLKAVGKVKKAIEEFVEYVKNNEPGTLIYAAWQEKEDETRFMHFFIFKDALAHEAHSKSDAVKRFESVYSSELVGKEVIFTDFISVAGKIE